MARGSSGGGYLEQNPLARLVVVAFVFVVAVVATVWMYVDWEGFVAAAAGGEPSDNPDKDWLVQLLGPVAVVVFGAGLGASWDSYLRWRDSAPRVRRQGARVTALEHPRFPVDRRLRASMFVAALVGGALTAGLVGALVWIIVATGWGIAFFVFCFLVIGLSQAGHRGTPAWDANEERERVERHLDRLCLHAGWAPPAVEIVADDAPQLWTSAMTRRHATVHATTGFVRAATDDELAAALAHELTHIAHGDAVVMTLVGGPPSWLVGGVRASLREGEWRARLGALLFGGPLALMALPAFLAATFLSRQREFAADYGAAVLTGSPAQVAAAIGRFSRTLRRRREKDLRSPTGGDLLYFVPPGRERRWLGRLWAAHPPLAARLERLEAMERRLQAPSS